MANTKSLLLGLIAAAAAAYSHSLVRDAERDVFYRGSLSYQGRIEHYQGIPYGQSTSGQHRFAPPRAVEITKGTVIDATTSGTACPQPDQDSPPAFFKPVKIGEDCLNLFVARPANTTARDALPVLVWIHGGGFMYGSGKDAHTDPDKLIALSIELGQPVIFVGINFRLGIFGFAASDTLKEQKSENLALRDQRLALEWVQHNIAAFGGNPNRITAYGLSSGGTATSFHHVSFGGEKGVPFTQAYMMSGPTGTSRNQSRESTKTNTAVVAQKLGCPIEGEDMLECLRGIEMNQLIESAWSYAIELHPPMGLHTYLPVVDDDFLPDRASQLLKQGRFVKNIPSIHAWTEDDGAMNVGPPVLAQDEQGLLAILQPWISSALNETQINKLLEVYPAADFEEAARIYNADKPVGTPDVSAHWYRGSAFVRDMLFACPSIDFTRHVYTHTRASVNQDFDNVRMYQLNQSVMKPMLNAMGMGYVGAAHGSDTHYVFNGVFPEGHIEEQDLQLARQLSSSVINFAYTGNPVNSGSDTFESWPVAYDITSSVSNQQDSTPSSIDILVVGGPHGTTPVSLSRDASLAGSVIRQSTRAYDSIVQGLDGLQQQMMGVLELGRMNSPAQQQAQVAVEKQKLFIRCEFVNSIADALSV